MHFFSDGLGEIFIEEDSKSGKANMINYYTLVNLGEGIQESFVLFL